MALLADQIPLFWLNKGFVSIKMRAKKCDLAGLDLEMVCR